MTGFDQIEHASLTDVGVRRSHNQDAHGTLLATDAEQWEGRGHVFLVADGMGAHAVGELASELAVNTIPHTYHKYAHQGPIAALRKAFTEANATIHAKGQQNPEFEGMGTTSTALLVRPEGVWIGHVGDSRAYRIRKGQIEQLSFDHSLVWELAKRQGVDPDGLKHVPSNVIVRSLGPESLVQIDVEGPHPVEQGDVYLLCSDGLSGQVTDPEIGAIAAGLPPAEACRFLIDLANLRGGPDNITVMIVRAGSDADASSPSALKKARWYRRVPWPYSVLTCAGLLAAAAVTLMYYQWQLLGMVAFMLAATALIPGLVGLFLYLAEEQRRLAAEPDVPRKTQVYRRKPCVIDRTSVERLAKLMLELKQKTEAVAVEVNWDEYRGHFERAEKHFAENNLLEAFREYCRATRSLTAAQARQRNKEEVFQPVWDRHSEKPPQKGE